MRRRRYRIEDLPAELRDRIVVHPLTGCWEWQHPDGADYLRYGHCCWEGVRGSTHRLVYRLLAGAIAEGLVLDHVYARGCRSHSCCNPAHLEPVTQRENARRANAANIGSGVASYVLLRLATGRARERDWDLAGAAWELPFPIHPERVASPHALGAREVDPSLTYGSTLNDPILTTEQAAEIVGLKPARLAQLRRRPHGPTYFKAGRGVRYRRSWLEEWMRQQEAARVAANPAA